VNEDEVAATLKWQKRNRLVRGTGIDAPNIFGVEVRGQAGRKQFQFIT
jgi:hypothetical protein